MRILRSQYLQYQKSVTTTTTLSAFKHLKNASPKLCSMTRIQQQNTEQQLISVNGERPTNVQARRRNSLYVPTESIKISARAQQPELIQNRRQTVAHCLDVPPPTQLKSLNIKLLNAQYQTGKINVVLHFYNEGPKWYTNLYRSYENDIWKRVERAVPTKKFKWCFQCRLCTRALSCFYTLKNHLNIHLGFKPNRCASCPKKYPSRQSLVRHCKKLKHELQVNTQVPPGGLNNTNINICKLN